MKRILISRTDRIGDVLISTPVIKAVRKRFPQSRISVMVRPYARDIVLGNPYLDEVIIYDKYGSERSFYRSLKFALNLRRKKSNIQLWIKEKVAYINLAAELRFLVRGINQLKIF